MASPHPPEPSALRDNPGSGTELPYNVVSLFESGAIMLHIGCNERHRHSARGRPCQFGASPSKFANHRSPSRVVVDPSGSRRIIGPYRERHGEAIYRFKGAMLPSDFFRRNVVLSFQEDAIGIRLRDVIGIDNMMWGSDYPHSESTFPQSRKILAEILAGVPDDEQTKIAGGNTARVYHFDVPRPTALREEPTSLLIDEAIPDRTAAFTHATMIKYDNPHRAAYR
jgi:Amidohydrolase